MTATVGDESRAGARRVAMLSVHTSPLDQPGVGDAGGLNVYVTEVATRLAAVGTHVDIYTRAARPNEVTPVEVGERVTLHYLGSGRGGQVDKDDLPAELCSLTSDFLRSESHRDPVDVIHSHYWLSGHVGAVASDCWGVPLVHSMHTMARVKNRSLAAGDRPESSMRVLGEQRVVDTSHHLIANTTAERTELVELYGADAERTSVIAPGVDLAVYSPGDRSRARSAVDLPREAIVLLFVGRIQPLKGPDLFLQATAEFVHRYPELRDRVLCVICGGFSGVAPDRRDDLAKLAASLGISDLVRFEPPKQRAVLADWFRSADVVCVPSHSESFGLVAIEAQACGIPVIAANVGGLTTSVSHDVSGVLVDGREPGDWAGAIAEIVTKPRYRTRLSMGARSHALGFGWDATAQATLGAYRAARAHHARRRRGLELVPA